MMEKAPIPVDESRRLAALQSLHLLDTPTEERFDAITRRAVQELHVPISTISLLDDRREWFKSCQGLPEREGDRSISFCGHALFANRMFVIADTTKDARFADNPNVIGPPYVRFYAGMALYHLATGQPIAVFCVKDTRPRSFTPDEMGVFLGLAKEAESEINASR